MLENLDKIEWAKLGHAYGSADDVPDLLRNLASPDKVARDATYYTLYGNIYHQGTIYEATAYAVPFLIELLQEPSVEDKDQLLLFLNHVMEGTSYNDVHQHLGIFADERNNPEFQAEMQIELYWVKQSFIAVQEGLQVYLRLLDHSLAAVRAASATLLGKFMNDANLSVPKLYACLTQEKETQVQESLIRSLARLASYDSEPIQFIEKLATDSLIKPNLRRVAAVCLLRVAKDKTPDAIVKILTEAVTDYKPSKEVLDVDNLAIEELTYSLSLLGAERGALALIQILNHAPNGHDALAITNWLLELAFSERRLNYAFASMSRTKEGKWEHDFSLDNAGKQAVQEELANSDKQVVLRANLTHLQRQALHAIITSDKFWEIETNLLNVYRLPTARTDLQALIA